MPGLMKISLIVGAVFGGLAMAGLISVINLTLLLPRAREQARQEMALDQARKDIEAERARRKDDAQLQGLSDYDLCVRHLGRVPVCEQLAVRGLDEK